MPSKLNRIISHFHVMSLSQVKRHQPFSFALRGINPIPSDGGEAGPALGHSWRVGRALIFNSTAGSLLQQPQGCSHQACPLPGSTTGHHFNHFYLCTFAFSSSPRSRSLIACSARSQLENHFSELIGELFIRIIHEWPGSVGHSSHTRRHRGAMGTSWAWSISCVFLQMCRWVIHCPSTQIKTQRLCWRKGEVPVQSCWEMAPGAISGHELGDGAVLYGNGAVCFQKYFS